MHLLIYVFDILHSVSACNFLTYFNPSISFSIFQVKRPSAAAAAAASAFLLAQRHLVTGAGMRAEDIIIINYNFDFVLFELFTFFVRTFFVS